MTEPTIGIEFVLPDGRTKTCRARIGDRLLDVALENKIERIEGLCGGNLNCATCHMIVLSPWCEKLQPPTADEIDTLDFAYNVEASSRLGCQIIITPQLDGLTVRIPTL